MCALSAKLVEQHGRKEEYCDEEYNFILDFNNTSKEEVRQHKLISFHRVVLKLKNEGSKYILACWKKYLENEPLAPNHSILHNLYGFDSHTVRTIVRVLGLESPKTRTVLLYGSSNVGKSILANALLAPWAPGYIQRDGGTNVHWLEHVYRKSFILWEEPSIHMSNIEDTKLLMGGEKIIINRKNKNLLERTNSAAVVVTTNREIWKYGGEALVNRCFIIVLSTPVASITAARISTADILTYMLDAHAGRYD